MKGSLERIRSAITDPRTRAVSFDVFDTLLVRPFWEPSDLFCFLDLEEEQLAGASDVVHFSACRQEAESRARIAARALGREDVTIRDIYAEIGKTGLFSANTVRRLMDGEMELEQRFCSARESARALVDLAVSSGKRIAAISDMYLPSSLIAAILEKNGFPKFERVFVSCEAGAAKRGGRLYEYAAAELGVKMREIVHIGDNPRSDVMIPGKLGIRAFLYERTVHSLYGGRRPLRGRAFRHAYWQLRSPLPNIRAMNRLGVRCMLAVAANMVYDDPFRAEGTGGGYAGDPALFGALALGMNAMAHALWLTGIASEDEYDRALFFSRDGYLVHRGFALLQEYAPRRVRAEYVRFSRKAVLPLILCGGKEQLTGADACVSYRLHTPSSLAGLLRPVLREDAQLPGDVCKDEWDSPFSSAMRMMEFLAYLQDEYVGERRSGDVMTGYRQYFSAFMGGRILTFDTGYHLRQEILLRGSFPDTQITACFTHASDDLAVRRGMLGDIRTRSFYAAPPFVSGLPREQFQAECAPSCIGYTPDGLPVMEEGERQPLLEEMHRYALEYMERFVSIFREDVFRIPMTYTDACHPLESFLHSPGRAELRWVRGLETEDDFDWSISGLGCFERWRRMRLHYRTARLHLSKPAEYAVWAVYFGLHDRAELMRRVRRAFAALGRRLRR